MSKVLLQVDVFIFPGAMVGLALAVVDMLRIVNTIAQLQHGTQASVVRWRLLDANAMPIDRSDPVLGPYCQSNTQPDAAAGEPDAVARASFVPPLHTHNVPAIRKSVRDLPMVTAYLAQSLRDGHCVGTLINGAWLVASGAGSGARSMALPWFLVSAFAGDFPDVELRADAPWVDDGRVVSGAVPCALSDVVMALLARALSPELMRVCENVFRHNPERHRMVVQARQEHHIQVTRDSVLALAMEWLDAHLEEPYQLRAVARAASVSPRTLLRHFQLVLGLTPLDYLHRQRCKRACILLEVTLDNIPAIARACGYSDPAAFRRIFNRIEGRSPSEHRALHALRATRARWQVENTTGS